MAGWTGELQQRQRVNNSRDLIQSDLFAHLVGVVQRVLPLQEHPLLLGAGQATRQPRGQGAGRDACGGRAATGDAVSQSVRQSEGRSPDSFVFCRISWARTAFHKVSFTLKTTSSGKRSTLL